MLPEETELLEEDMKLDRKKRAEARKERYPDEPVSNGLEVVASLLFSAPRPSVQCTRSMWLVCCLHTLK